MSEVCVCSVNIIDDNKIANITPSDVSNNGKEMTKRKSYHSKCIVEGCVKNARGKTHKCIAHFGGVKCMMDNCTSSAKKNNLCTKHGGVSVRCQHPECIKPARSPYTFCFKHGGKKLCITQNCEHSARGRSDKCVKCGGGNICVHPDCKKQEATAKYHLCREHLKLLLVSDPNILSSLSVPLKRNLLK